MTRSGYWLKAAKAAVEDPNRWIRAARTLIENPSRAGWALEDAFGEWHATAWGEYRAIFADDDGIVHTPSCEEVALGYCLMAAIAADEQHDAIMKAAEERQREFEDVSTAVDYDNDCAP